MQKFFMFGKYTAEAVKGIGSSRTQKAVAALGKYGGKIDAMYALLGEHDLVLIADLPSLEDAVKASVALNRLTGISFSTASAIPVDQFDKLIAEA